MISELAMNNRTDRVDGKSKNDIPIRLLVAFFYSSKSANDSAGERRRQSSNEDSLTWIFPLHGQRHVGG